jgi:hypothetical protein
MLRVGPLIIALVVEAVASIVTVAWLTFGLGSTIVSPCHPSGLLVVHPYLHPFPRSYQVFILSWFGSKLP